ncbi:hypothetical protein OGAPHI_004996 [Ogataea philodendri]|uniref:DNA damage-binding protein CMR1 n=1 Tax=Ogataea philodendri TaxID=1378263 RepID=A0A9P8P1V0_9ASCO|nr:uncharacterized protein OGAPHI_004996 [Ogataea philodendri]KAH3663595.1 hypothetical protein OGAPHI_004996 [Ogataea philodendri]
MVALSEFERQRQQNIARNKELFKKLNLETLSREFKKELPEETKRSNSNGPKPKKVKKEAPVPTRRSNRLAGVQANTEEERKANEEAELAKQKAEELERLKKIRLSGDFKLTDVISADENDNKEVLDKLLKLGQSVSFGDFFDTIKTKEATKDVKSARESMDSLGLYDKLPASELRLTASRMTSITFHPSTTRKVVIGGDTGGEMGIWSVDDDTDSRPETTHLKHHGSNIPRIRIRNEKPKEIVSCSYDGSIRVLDLDKHNSSSVLDLDSEYGGAASFSDLHFLDPNVAAFSTMEGEFGTFDLREKQQSRSKMNILQLHDKKIGGFGVNPNFTQQIATSSLDRTLKVWDLRKVAASTWSERENAKSPHCMGSYRSRLSISTADWNKSGDIVCNGYDNTINIFRLGDTSKLAPDHVFEPIVEEAEEGQIPVNMEPNFKMAHNCQSGRWVTVLKARWQADPQDGVEKCIIANMKKAMDIFDRNGNQLAHLDDETMTAVPAVSCFHPTQNWIVGGNSSGKAFLFT